MGEDEDLPFGTDVFPGGEFDPHGSTGSLFTPRDRPRGILSKTDRDYLHGLKDYAQPQTDANRRQEIRERVKNGIMDFLLLFTLLPRDETEKIFDELDEADDLELNITQMIAFLYIGLADNRPLFEKCITSGVYWGEAAVGGSENSGTISNVDLSLELEFDPDIDRLVERLEKGHELTDSEIGAVAKAGRLQPEHLEDIKESGFSFADMDPVD